MKQLQIIINLMALIKIWITQISLHRRDFIQNVFVVFSIPRIGISVLSLLKLSLISSEPFDCKFLVYSNSTGNIYCGPCQLFESISVFATVGFSNWKEGEENILHNENSITHKTCVVNMSQ